MDPAIHHCFALQYHTSYDPVTIYEHNIPHTQAWMNTEGNDHVWPTCTASYHYGLY